MIQELGIRQQTWPAVYTAELPVGSRSAIGTVDGHTVIVLSPSLTVAERDVVLFKCLALLGDPAAISAN